MPKNTIAAANDINEFTQSSSGDVHVDVRMSTDESSQEDLCNVTENKEDCESLNSKYVSKPDADEPQRPNLNKYAPRTFSKERFQRDFQVSWFEKYTWLGFSVDKSCGYCYACQK